MEAATGSNRPDLARPGSNRRIAYAIISVALFLAPRAFDGSEAGGLLAAILLAGMILVLMRVLHIIHLMKVVPGGGTLSRH